MKVKKHVDSTVEKFFGTVSNSLHGEELHTNPTNVPKIFGRQNCVCSSSTLHKKLDLHILWFRRRRAYKI